MEIKAQIAEQSPKVIVDNVVPVDRRVGGSKNAANRENSSSLTSDFKGSVKAATTQNISLSGLLTIDGVSLSQGDRVLVKDQNIASENGIYIASGSSWGRSNDSNSSSKVNSGLFVFVETGTSNADTAWILTSDGPIDLGTTSLTFSRFGGPISSEVKTELLAGNAVNLVYNAASDTLTIDVDVSADVSTEILAGNQINLSYNSQADTLTVAVESSPLFTGLDINSNLIRLRTAKTPVSSSDTGKAGEFCWDSSYLYICTSTNNWRRIPHSSW